MTEFKDGRRYIILELEDAKLIAGAVQTRLVPSSGPHVPVHLAKIRKAVSRVKADTGADIQDVVDQLLGVEACPACVIEDQQRSCIAWDVQKLGRRLRRLLERARHERPPGPGPEPKEE